MRPEFNFLGAAGVALVAAVVRDGELPSLTRPAIATAVLVVVAASLSKTTFAPVVDGLGRLLLIAAIMGFGLVLYRKQTKKG